MISDPSNCSYIRWTLPDTGLPCDPGEVGLLPLHFSDEEAEAWGRLGGFLTPVHPAASGPGLGHPASKAPTRWPVAATDGP